MRARGARSIVNASATSQDLHAEEIKRPPGARPQRCHRGRRRTAPAEVVAASKVPSPPQCQPQAQDWTLLRRMVVHPVMESIAAASISASICLPGDASGRRRRKLSIDAGELAQWNAATDFKLFEVDDPRSNVQDGSHASMDTCLTWVTAVSIDQGKAVEVSIYAKLPQLFQEMLASQHFECNWRLCQGLVRSVPQNMSTAAVNSIDIDSTILAPTPPEFLLPLLPHQQKSVAWMAMRERCSDLCMCEHQREVPIDCQGSDLRLELRVDEAFALRGGLLCDPVGSGKTATMFALICHERSTCTAIPGRLQKSAATFVTSATLILCPANVHAQWISEADKFCPNALRIIALRDSSDLCRTSVDKLMGADVVVSTYDLLIESCEAPFMLKDLCWHRVVLDEFHEICSQRASIDPKRNRCIDIALRCLEVGRRWGLSGTPEAFLSSTAAAVRAARLFRCDVSARTVASFAEHFCRQSRVEMTIETAERVVSVSHTAAERAVYANQQYESSFPYLAGWEQLRSYSAKVQQLLMLCSHFNVTDYKGTALELTAEEICDEILKKKRTAIDAAKLEVLRLLGGFWYDLGAELELMPTLPEFLDCSRMANAALDEISEPVRQLLQPHIKTFKDFVDSVAEVHAQLNLAEQSYDFFKRTWDALRGSDGCIHCPVCLEHVEAVSVYVLHCGHTLCHSCAARLLSAKCPVCRSPVQDLKSGRCVRRERFHYSVVSPHERVIEGRGHWSSKLQCVVGAVESIQMQDPQAKIIIFMQWEALRRRVSGVLHQVGLSHLSLTGDIFQRTRVLQQFCTDAEISLLLLSLEDSASGTNLTVASHVFLLHPMLASSREESLSFEAQAIGRVRRLGQTRIVHVWRFVTKSTVEEILWGLIRQDADDQ